MLRSLFGRPSVVAAICMCIALVVIALLAPWISPQNPYDLASLNIVDGRLSPGARGVGGHLYLLGSDALGRDMLAAMMYGLRISLGVGLLSGVVAMSLGTTLGLVAAYFGGHVDALVMRTVDLMLGFSAILVALMMLAILRQGVDEVILALVIVQRAYFARTVRSVAAVERRKEYIEAALCLGLSHRRALQSTAAQLPAARHRHRAGADRCRYCNGSDAQLSRCWSTRHAAVARSADRQRLSAAHCRLLLDQRLSGSFAPPAGFQHEYRWRQPARSAERAPTEIGFAHVHSYFVRAESTHAFFTSSGVAKAVDDVSFDVAAGEIVGLVGESGSGKSITGFSVLGLVDPPGRIVGGRVLFKGDDLTAFTPEALRRLRGNRIAMIFQGPMMTLNPVLRIDTQMIEAVQAHQRVSRGRARERSRDALAAIGIPSPDERLRAYPHQLSGGMRQRVAIAIALLHDPDLIIADEPTTALDVTIQAQILAEVQKLCARSNTAMVWVSHTHMTNSASCCERSRRWMRNLRGLCGKRRCRAN